MNKIKFSKERFKVFQEVILGGRLHCRLFLDDASASILSYCCCWSFRGREVSFEPMRTDASAAPRVAGCTLRKNPPVGEAVLEARPKLLSRSVFRRDENDFIISNRSKFDHFELRLSIGLNFHVHESLIAPQCFVLFLDFRT